LVQRATWDLRRRRLESWTLGVKLRYGDFQTVTTSRALAAASSEDRVFVELAYELFARLYTRRLPVRHLGIELAQLKTAGDGQRQLFDEAGARQQRQLRRVVDQVRDRFGFQSMVEGSTTHLIDRLDQDHRGFRLRTPSLSR
jgi:DNA polymerase-4